MKDNTEFFKNLLDDQTASYDQQKRKQLGLVIYWMQEFQKCYSRNRKKYQTQIKLYRLVVVKCREYIKNVKDPKEKSYYWQKLVSEVYIYWDHRKLRQISEWQRQNSK